MKKYGVRGWTGNCGGLNGPYTVIIIRLESRSGSSEDSRLALKRIQRISEGVGKGGVENHDILACNESR